jgi:hypothetical protein
LFAPPGIDDPPIGTRPEPQLGRLSQHGRFIFPGFRQIIQALQRFRPAVQSFAGSVWQRCEYAKPDPFDAFDRIRKPAFRRTEVRLSKKMLPPLIRRYKSAWEMIQLLKMGDPPSAADDCWFCRPQWY